METKDIRVGGKYILQREKSGFSYGIGSDKFGQIVTVTDGPDRSGDYSVHHKAAGRDFYVTKDMLAPIPPTQKIVITTDGKETLARLYADKKDIKKAVATCSPDDTFDFMVGAKLALERLTEPEPKKEKLLTGKVVCIEARNSYTFTVGKTYPVVNGSMVNDTGFRYHAALLRDVDFPELFPGVRFVKVKE